MAHNYLDNFKALASDKKAIIHYDQLSRGQSSHLPEVLIDFWRISLFLEELDNLLAHSRGGMLTCAHAVKQPAGLLRLILESSPSDFYLGVLEVNLLRDQLPSEVQETLLEHEQASTINSLEYKAMTRLSSFSTCKSRC